MRVLQNELMQSLHLSQRVSMSATATVLLDDVSCIAEEREIRSLCAWNTGPLLLLHRGSSLALAPCAPSSIARQG